MRDITSLNAAEHGHVTDIEADSAALLMIFALSLPVVKKDSAVAETSQSHLVRALALGNALLAITSPGQQQESVRACVIPSRCGESYADGLRVRFYQKILTSPGLPMSTLPLLSSIPIASKLRQWTQTLAVCYTGSRLLKTSTMVCRPGSLLEGRHLGANVVHMDRAQHADSFRWSFTDPGPTRDAFSNMASSSSNRQKFITGLLQFMHTYDFDGLDLDWVCFYILFWLCHSILTEAGIPSSRRSWRAAWRHGELSSSNQGIEERSRKQGSLSNASYKLLVSQTLRCESHSRSY